MKCVCAAAFFVAASVFGYPICSSGQIKAGSLANCSVGDVELTSWSFSAPGYKGNAMVQISGAADYDADPETITLKFADPLQAPSTFTLSFIATLTNGYEFDYLKQNLATGKIPNTATVTGTFNGTAFATDGVSAGALSAGGPITLSDRVNVSIIGTVLQPAAPSTCHPLGQCKGGAIQDVEVRLYQTTSSPVAVPEPVAIALVGSGLLAFAAAGKIRRSK